MSEWNTYGDERRPVAAGFGVDISSQRLDDLDMRTLDAILAFRTAHGGGPAVFDLGCGLGAQTIRMASAGAAVFAFDVTDNGAALTAQAEEAGCRDLVNFYTKDIRQGFTDVPVQPDIVYSQRTLHYLAFADAEAVLRGLVQQATAGARFFLSASGLRSELGDGYPDKERAAAERYAPLAPAMQEKHSMRGPICLYDVVDMALLLEYAGLVPVNVYTSPFGNVKAEARKP